MATRPLSKAFVSVFAASLTGMASSLALSSVTEAAAQENPLSGTIRSVVVEGNQRIEARTVQSYLLVEPGDPFDPTRLDLSLKALFATNLFADVAFDRRGDDLVVKVVENPIINRVVFEGNSAIDDDKIREEIQAAPRGVFTAARVQADVQRILELYRQSGRFAANVNPQYRPLEQNRVDLIFEITEGPTTGVRSINFVGNEVFSDSRLRSEIVTRQSRWWRFFSSNDNYDPDRLDYDRELLRQFYQNNGYYNFSVTSAVADLTPDQEDFYITIAIDEGEQFTFGEVNVETQLEKLDSSALRRAVSISEGDLFRSDDVEDAIDSLTYAAGIAGFAFVDVQPRLVPNNEDNTVDLTLVVDEGPRVYIERINIVGNTATLDNVIRRELRISEGDAFNRVLLDRSRNRVRALGYFGEVEVEERPGSAPDRSVIDVKVEEQPTGELAFAAGFSSVDSFLIDASVTERNLRGRGQALSARVSASSRQQVVDLRFTEPRFLGRNLAAGVDVFSTRSDFLDVSSFETETTGAGLRLGFPLTDRTSMQLRYTLRQDEINVRDIPVAFDEDGNEIFVDVIDDNDTPDDPSDDTVAGQRFLVVDQDPLPTGATVGDICDPGVSVSTLNTFRVNRSLCLEERSDLSSILGYTFNWDRRNDPFEPTRGFDFSLSQDLAGLGGDVQYLRTETSGAVYRGLLPGVRASWRLSGGYIFPFGDNDSLRINNRFFRGGNSFRGFDVAGLGPRQIAILADENGTPTGEVQRLNALGGQLYYQSTMELTFPNYLPEEYGIDTRLFVDAGSLGVLPDKDLEFDEEGNTVIEDFNYQTRGGFVGPAAITIEDELSLRAAAGLSVLWDSPFGRIRFDFSQIIRKEQYDRTETFRFSTSTTF
jgi:outer membrane protein insertion porin family